MPSDAWFAARERMLKKMNKRNVPFLCRVFGHRYVYWVAGIGDVPCGVGLGGEIVARECRRCKVN